MSFLLHPLRRTATTNLTATPSSILTRTTHRTFSSSPKSSLARLTLVGRLGTDPELSETPNGKQLIKYVIGTSYGPKDARQTSWFRVVSFNTAEGTYGRDVTLGLTKGTLVYFEGDATMRTYEDADGKKQSALGLVQTKVEVLKRPQVKDEEIMLKMVVRLVND